MVVFEDFQQIAALRWSEDGKASSSTAQDIQFGDDLDHADGTSDASSQSQGLENAR